VADGKFTIKEQRFIDAYEGNATDAARKAGYKNPERSGWQNVNKREIWDAIWKREKRRENKKIATREERQAFWTGVIRDEEEQMQNRLKAADSLAKSEGDFIERRHVDHSTSDGTMKPAIIEVRAGDKSKD